MFKNILTQKLFLRFLDLLQNICLLNKKQELSSFIFPTRSSFHSRTWYVSSTIRSNEKLLPWVVHQVVYVCSYYNMI